LPTYAFSLLSCESVLADSALPDSVERVEFSDEVTLAIALEPSTNTSVLKDAPDAETTQVTIKSTGMGIFARDIQREADGALRDVKVYAHSPLCALCP
jgi:hypothetical protein